MVAIGFTSSTGTLATETGEPNGAVNAADDVLQWGGDAREAGDTCDAAAPMISTDFSIRMVWSL